MFIKRIPLTQIEFESPFSTKNHYDLPLYYNYGVGSAGFGAYREIVTHIKTTGWVLSGEHERFPLMYHYRIQESKLPRSNFDEAKHQNYVEYWNSNPEVDRYIRDRHSAPYEAVLLLEYFPDVLHKWSQKNSDRWPEIISHMKHTISFLEKEGIVHFDVHAGNIVLRESVPYLTDFGLVSDRQFDLGADERRFLNQHAGYDNAEFLCQVGNSLYGIYRQLKPHARSRVLRHIGETDVTDYGKAVTLLVENLEHIHGSHSMRLDNGYVDAILENRNVILTMHNFYGKLSRDPRKRARFSAAKIVPQMKTQDADQ